MNKVWLIIKREYLTRVKNRTFIIMTILGPLLIVGFYALIIGITVSQMEKPMTVNVVDMSELNIRKHFMEYTIKKPNSNVKFVFGKEDFLDAKDYLKTDEPSYQAILLFPPNALTNNSGIRLIYKDEKPSYSVKSTIDAEVNKAIEKIKMANEGIDTSYAKNVHTAISVSQIDVNKLGTEEEKNSEEIQAFRIALAIILGIAIYMFIFLYGVQVLKSVMEEKTNRIVEVIISSVKPTQLMMGKILGVALVGLTQFLILILFSTILTSALSIFISPTVMQQVQSGSVDAQLQVGSADLGGAIKGIFNMNFFLLIPAFLLFFIFGYLLYASLFAAIGAAVDSESDSQQFMMPVTLPLVFAFSMGQYVINAPNGGLAIFLSHFPLTSPIIMIARLALSDKPILGEAILSLVILILTFLLVVKFAAKIYRIGILMYGKKVTYKELFKWLRYKG